MSGTTTFIIPNSLPAYKCHKVVHAAKIDGLIPLRTGGWVLTFAPIGEDPRITLAVDAAYCDKHNPKPGGYFVVYEDGYQSYSPAEAFESGYTLMTEPMDDTDLTLMTGYDVRVDLATKPMKTYTLLLANGAKINVRASRYESWTNNGRSGYTLYVGDERVAYAADAVALLDADYAIIS